MIYQPIGSLLSDDLRSRPIGRLSGDRPGASKSRGARGPLGALSSDRRDRWLKPVCTVYGLIDDALESVEFFGDDCYGSIAKRF